MTDIPTFEEIKLSSANDVIDHLRPSHRFWQGPGRLWGFRGQPDAAQELTPTAFRNGCLQKYLDPNRWKNPDDEAEKSHRWIVQVENEIAAFEDFMHLANRVGLDVPGIDYVLSEGFGRKKQSPEMWPLSEVREGLAVARHHGVPARFFDFTYSGLVAAYFAAYSRWTKKEDYETEYFSIWATNLHFVHHSYPFAKARRIDSLHVSTARNPFIHAQNGFFLWDKQAIRDKWPPPPINEVLVHHSKTTEAAHCISQAPEHIQQHIAAPFVRKLMVHKNLAVELLYLLQEQEGISRASLMPTLDNVVAAYKDINLLRSERVVPG